MADQAAREEERLARHINADPTKAKCVGGLQPGNKGGVVAEHDVKPSEVAEGEGALSREEERLARHVAASNARAKTVDKPAEPEPEEQNLKCVVCRKVGGGKFCLVETKRNPKAPVHCKCFVCYECGNNLAGTNYGEDKRGHFLCAPCMKDAGLEGGVHSAEGEAELCAKCGSPILDNQAKVRAMGALYHADCFACDACGTRIHMSCFKGEGGRLYCSEACAKRGEDEAHKKAAGDAPKPAADGDKAGEEKKAEDYKVCSACGKALEGAFIVVGGQPMHKECFVCSKCNKQLGSEVYSVEGKMCCKECAEAAHK